jgi:hypothetical protein
MVWMFPVTEEGRFAGTVCYEVNAETGLHPDRKTQKKTKNKPAMSRVPCFRGPY